MQKPSQVAFDQDSRRRKTNLLKKPDGTITMRTVSDVGPTFLQRKVFNAFLYAAQRPGNRDKTLHEITFKELEDLIGLSSNNRKHIASMIDKLTSLKVHFGWRADGKDGTWGVAVLVPEVYVDEVNKKYLYSFPANLKEKMLDPQVYNLIEDFTIQNRFTAYSTLALYEIASRYATFSQKRTFEESWESWSLLLSGAPEPHAEYREFNKMLTRAVKQVNEHWHGYAVAVHTTMRGKKVQSLWFSISQTECMPRLTSEGSSPICSELAHKGRHIGLDDQELVSLLINFNEEYLMAQMDYTLARLSRGGSPVQNPRAFFMHAVKKNFAGTVGKPDVKAIVRNEEKRGALEGIMKEGEGPVQVIEPQVDASKMQLINELSEKSEEELASLIEDNVQALQEHHRTAYGGYLKRGRAGKLMIAALATVIMSDTQMKLA